MTRSALLGASILVALVAACSGGSKPAPAAAKPQATCTQGAAPVPEPGDSTKLPPFPGPMVLVQPTTMTAQLAEVGLDVKALPPFDELNRKQLGVVMKTFATSLGLKCIGCHDLVDYKKPSPRKNVAKRMWNDIVRVLVNEDGSPLYCDSCHQGTPQQIDRRDKSLVVSFMEDVFVARMKRVDGKEHDCGTCHGDPPDFKFLDPWRGAKR